MGRFVFLLAAMVFSQTPAFAETGVTATEIKLGQHAPLTGPLALYSLQNKTQLVYWDKVNEAGGINGRKVKLIIEDDGSNPQQALQATKKLVQKDQIFAFFGNMGFQHLSAYQWVRQQKIPDMFVTDSTLVHYKPLNHYTFPAIASFYSDGELMGKEIAKRWPGKKVGVIHMASGGGKECLDGLKAGLDGKAKVVAVNEVRFDAQNINSEILNMKKAGAEVVYIALAPPLTPSGMKFAKEQNYNPQWVLMFWNQIDELITLAGPASEGALSSNFIKLIGDTSDPAVKAHIEYVKAKMPGAPPNVLTEMGESYVQIMAEILKRAGKDLTREGLIKAAESMTGFKCDLCLKPITMNTKDHGVLDELVPVMVKKGKWTYDTN